MSGSHSAPSMRVEPTGAPHEWRAVCDCGWTLTTHGHRAEEAIRLQAERHERTFCPEHRPDRDDIIGFPA